MVIGWLVSSAVAVGHGESVQDGFPALNPPCGVAAIGLSFDGGQVEDFERGLLVGEMPTAPDGLPEPGVEAFDPVGGVDPALDRR